MDMLEFCLTYNTVNFEGLSDNELQQVKKSLDETETHQMAIHENFNDLKKKINSEISKRNLGS